MHRSDQPEDDTESARTRSGSRRNSASLSRRSSVKKDGEGKKTPSSASSGKKPAVKQNFELCITGKPLLKKSDRASSLPGYGRRPSSECIKKKTFDSPKRTPTPQSSKSRETSLEDDMSLDLSQVSDFEDTNLKYGGQKKLPLATSTPKTARSYQKPRSASLQMQVQKVQTTKRSQKPEARENDDTFSSSRDSFYKTSSVSNYTRYGGVSTELDYSSVSPEYSGQSSADLSPKNTTREDLGLSPRSQDLHLSSCCISTWQDCSDTENTKVEEYRKGDNGEWNNFWANYNNSIAKVPMKSYYDQCPTPYRTENIDLADLDFSTDGSRKRSPDNVRNINNIIRNEGLHLTPRETQNIIKCAHILGNVLTKAIERRSKEKDLDDKIQEMDVQVSDPEPDEKEIKKKTLTLDLKETVIPLEVKEEKRCETVMTQTDISLPNTKSAPRIFEKILRQLSKSSLEDTLGKKLSIDVREKDEVAKDVGKIETVENNTEKNNEMSSLEATDKNVLL